jgi:hypothetical protein
MLRAIFIICISTIISAGPVLAEGLVLSGKSNSRKAVFKSQTRLLDTRLSKQYSASVRLQPNPIVVPKDATVPRFRGNYKGEYLAVAKAAARKHSIPEDLFLRLVQQESGWNPSAQSHAGATGLAQLMPGTARKLGVNINWRWPPITRGRGRWRNIQASHPMPKPAIMCASFWAANWCRNSTGWSQLNGCRLFQTPLPRRVGFAGFR